MQADRLQIFGNAKILRSRLNSTLSERESQNISRILVEFVSKRPYHEVLLDRQMQFSERQFQAWNDAVQRLLAGEPLQYILGEAWFGPLQLKVKSGVLIPRPETEELAQWAVDLLRKRKKASPIYKVLDVGCGSGCIALYIKHQFPPAQVWALDRSTVAVQTTQENANALDLEIEVIQGDAFQLSEQLSQPFDLIISNPPYIPLREKAEMATQVSQHEPESALFVPDEDPLLFYREIAIQAKSMLGPGGILIFEIHESFAPEIRKLLSGINFKTIEVRKDLQGKNRMLSAML